MTKKKEFIPEIVYEEGSQIPFIQVPFGEQMPNRLFIYAYLHTGEYEPGPNGEDVPICDMDIVQYFSYNAAKELLDAETLDKLRVAFGLEPLQSAMAKGQAITERVSGKIDAEESEKGEESN